MIRVLMTAMLAALLLGACSRDASAPAQDHAEGDAHGDAHGDGEAVRLDAAALAAAGIRIETVGAHAMNEALRAPGEVVDNAYGTTLITPRVDALVVARHARLGDDVAAGAPLVTLSSVDVAAAQGALAIAEQEWSRVQALGRDAVSGRRHAEAQIAVEQARATARAYGVDGSGSANGEFTLTAPHAGRLTEDAFLVGQRVEPGYTLFRLVDESIVWVDARLPADSARRVAVGSTARIVLDATRLTGTVTQRAHRTSEDTRNALVRVEVRNDEDRLHSGDYVEVHLDAGSAGTPQLAVPTAAIVQLEGETVVFRQNADETLEPVPVRTGAVVGERTVVLEGIAAGERIVVDGAYTLKARILKSQLGEGHAH